MKKVAFAFALLLAALTLVACGGGDDDTTGETAAQGDTTAEEAPSGGEAEGGTAGSGGAVAIEADPGGALAYTAEEASAKAGKVTVDFTNPAPVGHDVVIEDSGGEDLIATEVITEGSESAAGDLKAGEYTFFCSVPGHREAGMEGTLTVE